MVNDPFFLSILNGRKVMSLSLLLECLGTLLAEVLLKNDGISSVAFVHGIRDIADEGNQADEEVDNHVD